MSELMRLLRETMLRAPDDEGAGGGADEGGEGGDAGAGEGAASGAEGAAEGAAEGDGGAAEGGEGGSDADWRTAITDDRLRDHAVRFASLNDLVKGNLDLRAERDRLKNTALVVPGEDADEETVKAFREKLGVPDSPDGYEFPEPEGELSEFEQQSRQQWAQRFHEMGVPKDTAARIVESWREDMGKAAEAVAQADQKFANETEAMLKREWGAEFDRNKGIAATAGKELFGEDWDAMKEAQTKEGRLLLDHPAMLKMLARVGREMQEGSLAMDESTRSTIEDQATEARQKRNEAMGRGDRDAARRWDEKERELLGKLHGSGPIVGAQGRAA